MLAIIIILLFSAIVVVVAAADDTATCSGMVPLRARVDQVSITEFGGVGDGKTVNTKAFRDAIYRIQHLRRRKGGSLLYIPPGIYLTDTFNVTSHMTLFLASGAVIKATQARMEQLMVKEMFGGTCGGEKLFNILDHIS